MLFTQIIIASVIGSIFALVGGVILLWKKDLAKKFSLYLISFAAGSLLGAAFFELLPKILEKKDATSIFTFTISGIIALFIFEKILKWYHCHNREVCNYHTFSSAVLFGDAIHNFIDGVIIALSFSLDVGAGIAATIAIFFHEVPQEIGDFGVLIHAGYKKSKVLSYNFLTALSTPLGAAFGYFSLSQISNYIPYFISFAAGSFIYIAASDLMPEIRHKTRGVNLIHILVIIAGVLLIKSL